MGNRTACVVFVIVEKIVSDVLEIYKIQNNFLI